MAMFALRELIIWHTCIFMKWEFCVLSQCKHFCLTFSQNNPILISCGCYDTKGSTGVLQKYQCPFSVVCSRSRNRSRRKKKVVNQLRSCNFYIATTMLLKWALCMLSRGFIECDGKDLKPAVLRKNKFSVFHQHWFKATLNTETGQHFSSTFDCCDTQTVVPQVIVASVDLCTDPLIDACNICLSAFASGTKQAASWGID